MRSHFPRAPWNSLTSFSPPLLLCADAPAPRFLRLCLRSLTLQVVSARLTRSFSTQPCLGTLTSRYIPGSTRPGGRKGSHQKLSRKEARKQGREQAKVRKAAYFFGHTAAVTSRPQTYTYARAPTAPANGKGKEKQHVHADVRRSGSLAPAAIKRPIEKEHAGAPKRKKVKFAEPEASALKKPSTKENAPDSSQLKHKPKKKEPTALEKLAARAGASSSFGAALPKFKGPRTQQEKHEDAYIEYLESKLGWNKAGARTGRYGKGLEEDGLNGECLQDQMPKRKC
jgi:hypothetical protein